MSTDYIMSSRVSAVISSVIPSIVPALILAALTFLPKCTGSEPLYSNFRYVVEGDHVTVPGTDIRLPTPRHCYYYIEDSGYYSCIARQDGELMDVFLGHEGGLQSMSGGVVIGATGYFRYMPGRDGRANEPRLRLGTMFPQGRTGTYVDCISYDEARVYAIRDGVETTYDYGFNEVGGRHGRECTITYDLW